ncbi:MAG: hypothetical protein K0R29_1948 [Pseudobdellovibrio sp.]|jgi:hypothetical protein|nr:hypothetical protein [Pseudobdellovibrio sp.]
MIKTIALSIVAYTVLIACILFAITDKGLAVGAILGGLTVFVSFAGLAAYWHLIFVKKHIAFVLLIIIFKYLILIGLLWSVYTQKWINPIGFCIGLTALMFSLIVALIVKKFEKKSQT